jgi:hypothetical protein
VRALNPRKVIRFAIILLIAWIVYEVYDAGRGGMMPPAPQPVIMDKGRAHGERLTTHSWAIEYDKIVGNSDQSVLDLEGVHNGVFFRNGKPFLHLRAKHITVNSVTHDMSAVGPLHIETVDPKHFRSLDTTALTWNQASKLLILPNETTIKGGKNDPPLVVRSVTVETEKGQMHMEGIRGRIKP